MTAILKSAVCVVCVCVLCPGGINQPPKEESMKGREMGGAPCPGMKVQPPMEETALTTVIAEPDSVKSDVSEDCDKQPLITNP